MKILLYGELWEGTHVDAIAKVLEGLKIEHKVFDLWKYFLNSHEARNIVDNYYSRIYNRLAYHQIEKKINKELINCVNSYHPTTFIISKGVNIYPETLNAISGNSIMIINWNPDDYFNKKNSSKNLIDSLSIYDIVISSRTNRFDQYKYNGIKRIEFVDWYYIPWLHKKEHGSKIIENKILYVGAYSNKRDWFLSNISDEYSLEVYGGCWAKSKFLKKRKNTVINRQILKQKQFPEKFYQAKINLNILNDLNFDETNLKLFEIPACSGFLLSSYSEASKKILEADTDCKYFKIWDFNAVNNQISEIFKMSNYEFEEVRNNGYNKIIAGSNTINDRVESILKYCI